MVVNAQITGISKSIPAETYIDARITNVSTSIPAEPAPAPSVISAEIISLVPSIPSEPAPAPAVVNAEIVSVIPSIPSEPAPAPAPAPVVSAKIVSVVPSIPPEGIVLPPIVAEKEYKVLPSPPATLKGAGLQIYKDLDTALYEKNAGAVLSLLRQAVITPASPVAVLTIILGIVEVVGAILAVVGSYPFANFLREEALQTIDMAIRTAQQNKDIEGMKKLFAMKEDILNRTFWEKVIGAIPVVNVVAACREYFEASAAKLEEDRRAMDTMISQIQAEEQVGTLKVTANVSGADVYIDGTKKGIVPYEASLAARYYHVLVTKFQYTEYEEDVLVKKGETIEVKAVINPIAQPSAGKGTLKLVVEPNDADVSIAGHPEIKKMGNYELDKGTYTINVSKEGFYSKTATAVITPGEVSNVSVILTPIPAPEKEAAGILSIRVIPENAAVSVAGISSITESGDYEIPSGVYTIKASKEGFYDKYATAYVKAGETYVVSTQLSQKPEYPTPSVPGAVPTESPEPEVQPAPTAPAEEITVPMEPYKKTYNAWKYSINAVAKDTGEVLHAAIFIDGAAIGHYTPWSVYLYPESRYILRLEKWGYQTAEVEINTPPLPE